VVAAIEQFMAEARSGRAGRKHSAVSAFDRVGDNDLLAHLALRVVLDAVGSRPALTKTAIHLGSLIDDELFYREFKEQQPSAYRAVVRKLETKINSRYKRNSSRITGNKLGVK